MSQPVSFLQRRRLAEFVAALVVLTLAAWRPLSQTLALAQNDPEYSYILLVVPIALAFAFIARPDDTKEIRSVLPAVILSGAVVALAVFSATHSFADTTASLSLKLLMPSFDCSVFR